MVPLKSKGLKSKGFWRVCVTHPLISEMKTRLQKVSSVFSCLHRANEALGGAFY